MGDRTGLYWKQPSLTANKLQTQKGDIYKKDYNLQLLSVAGDWIYNLAGFCCLFFYKCSDITAILVEPYTVAALYFFNAYMAAISHNKHNSASNCFISN